MAEKKGKKNFANLVRKSRRTIGFPGKQTVSFFYVFFKTWNKEKGIKKHVSNVFSRGLRETRTHKKKYFKGEKKENCVLFLIKKIS